MGTSSCDYARSKGYSLCHIGMARAPSANIHCLTSPCNGPGGHCCYQAELPSEAKRRIGPGGKARLTTGRPVRWEALRPMAPKPVSLGPDYAE